MRYKRKKRSSKGSLEEFCCIDGELRAVLLGLGTTFFGYLDLFDMQFRKEEI